MSSTKPEVHNVLHSCQRRIKPEVTCIENVVKFGLCFSDMRADRQTSRETDRHTDTLITILCIGSEVMTPQAAIITDEKQLYNYVINGK